MAGADVGSLRNTQVLSFVKRAAALRVKYRTQTVTGNDRRCLEPSSVAAHPMNRNGVRVNGQRCEELFKQVFGKFDYEEACHGAVCIEIAPGEVEVARWHEAASPDDRLAALPVAYLAYSSLGATHINQVLRNILGKAAVLECHAATDASGRLSLQLVEAHDAALAAACRTGLRWEVLSSAISKEEPDGIVCIQAALNDPSNSIMLMHEMQIIKHMSRVCMIETNAAGEVLLESVRARLTAEGFPGIEAPGFQVLLRFVIDQGAGGEHAFVQPLVDFHQLLVNPRVRRLRDSHFRVVLSVPSPPARVILLKAAYGCPASSIRDGWIDYFGPSHVARLCSERVHLCKAAEGLYYRFHTQYEAAGFWKHAPQGKRQLHLFDIELGRVLLAKEGYSGTMQEVESLSGQFDARARSSIETTALAGLPIPDPLACPEPASSRDTKGASLLARLAEYTAEGRLVPRPTEPQRAVCAQGVPWQHVPDPEAHSLLLDKCRVLHGLSLAAQCLPLPGVAEISVTCAGKVMCVRAERPFRTGTLVLLPLVPGHLQVATDSVHPHSVPVWTGARTLYLVPSWKTGWHTPFWAVRRSTDAGECNSALAELNDNVVHSLAGSGIIAAPTFTHVLTESAKVPCLVNSEDVEEGTEIVMLLEAAGANASKGKAATRGSGTRAQVQAGKVKKPRT